MSLSRRRFLKATASLGGGLMLSFHLPAVANRRPYEGVKTGAEINAWLTIVPDSTITIRVAQSEMGQGVMTALPMIVGDELEVDWRNVKVEYADANRNLQGEPYHSMGTGGSGAVRHSRVFLQQAGAEARERLIKAAAELWGVDPATCIADYGKIHHRPSRRSVEYGEVAALAAQVSVANVKIKTPQDFTLMGLATRRIDTPSKVDGSAIFGMDVRVEGMVYAAVVHCPVIGGSLRNYKFNAVRNMPGVIQAVRLDNGVAIVADTYWQAKKAVDALPVEWDVGVMNDSYSEIWRREYSEALSQNGTLADQQGNADVVLDTAEHTKASDYFVPYLAHACMEPMNCTAHVTQDRVDVWAGVQNPDKALQVAAKTANIDPAKVYVHNCYLGGGFGRRSNTDYVEEAVQVAAEVGLPVQLIWSREDDTRGGRYRPMAAVRFKAGFDLDKNLMAFTCHSVCHSILTDMGRKPDDGIDPTSIEGLVDMPYKVDHTTFTHTIKNTHMTSWWWRSVGNSQNVFARECFVDEMAEEARMDPLAFRRKYLAHQPDMLNVLTELERRANWKNPMKLGRARGMAINECFGTIVAQAVELSLNDSGGVILHKIVSVVDCGNVVNPQTAEMQIESGVVFGLTAALYGKITVENGRVLEDNLDTYQMLSMAETPDMETYFIPATGDKWGGLGEPGVPCIAPAVVNAVYRLTKRRIRSLPVSDYYLQMGR